VDQISKGYNIDNGMFELKLNSTTELRAVQTDGDGPSEGGHVHSEWRNCLT
jgi:hypothetical protein